MIDKASAWQRLPEEMRELRQWAVAGKDKAPLSIDAKGNIYRTSVTRPSEWLSFEQACELAYERGYDVGFILNEADPFTCIDLDVKDAATAPEHPDKWTTPEQFDRFVSITSQLDSYTELSRGGKGWHVWVRGGIGRGFRRDGVEVYSQERFIISTGNTMGPVKPVVERQAMLTNLVSRMLPAPKEYLLQEHPETEDDWSVLERAVNASNSDKFSSLWRGEWSNLGFPSQSEADLALLSMFTFYTESNAQVRRMFRESQLGKREKAVKDDRYLNTTLTTIRQRMERERQVDISGIVSAAQTLGELTHEQRVAQEVARIQGVASPLSADDPFGVEQRSSTALHVQQAEPLQAPAPPEVAAAALAPVSAEVVHAGESGLPWPPGFVGQIAQFIYQSSPRPVKEVSIVAALGLVAGITGKAWHIPQSGLNIYVILIARSAVGKEAMHSGIASIIKACGRENPTFYKYVDFTEYASGPALIKACVGNPCFLNVSGEWGRKLKRLANEDGRDGALATLRTQMTNLYQKSGPAAIVGGIGYSHQDNNVASVAGVSYSMIGETTPGTFYESLTESMMEDGFLSRFLVIEYEGQRPVANEYTLDAPDVALRTALNNMAMQADLMIAKDYSHAIGRDDESALMMQAFELECDGNINGTNDESRRQMWNRASLKSLRIAGLLAVADNWMTPCIRREHVEWAQDVVRRDIAIMKRRLEGGDVGSGDTARERKVVAVLKEYLLNPIPASYKVDDAMRQNSIVPRNYLQVRVNRAAAFYNHKFGVKKALDETIAGLISDGYLMEVQKDKVVEAYNYQGKAYRVVKLPDFEALSKS